jgi:hypothetical protein
MKTFKEWAEENHPETVNEFFTKALGAVKGAAKKVANNRRYQQLAVGAKRAGEAASRIFGDDPHERQNDNREQAKRGKEWAGIMDRMRQEEQ